MPGRFMLLMAGAFALARSETNPPSVSIPAEIGLPGVFETHSSRAMRAGDIVFGVSNRTHSGLSMVEGGKLNGDSGDRILEDAAVSTFRGFLAAGLGWGFDLSLALPWYYEYLPGAQSAPETWSVGDFSGILKVRLPWEIPFASVSLFATATVPTSSENGSVLPKQLAYHPAQGRLPDPLYHPSGLSKPRAGVGAGITFNLTDAMEGPQVALHANVSGDRTFAEDAWNPVGILAASIAAEAFLTERLRLEAEYRHQRQAVDWEVLGSPLGRSTTLGGGLGWIGRNGLNIRLGGVVAPEAWNPYRSLAYVSDQARKYTLQYRLQPTLSGFLQIAWQGFPLSRDRDHDSVPDSRDRCPTQAEDRDGFRDADGCPDSDNDGDVIPDDADGCPYVPEDHDGFEDGDGCPEQDNDHDARLDSADHCPNDPEDADLYLDEDGCPDLDDDMDGIPDAVDKCPRDAENRNGMEDEDGCPEKDTDGDRIPDSRDKCPREDEIVNFYQDEDGCPDEKPEPIRDGILTGVEFQPGGTELLPVSSMVLDGLAARLFAYPATEIEIQGHVDKRDKWDKKDSGDERQDTFGTDSKELSRARAEAVVEYLAKRGVESARMNPVGYGGSWPLGPSSTARGRAANRRIEIRRLN